MGSAHSAVSPQRRSSSVISITLRQESGHSVHEAEKSRLKRRLCEMSGVRQSDISKAISVVETHDDILDSFRVLLDAMDSISKEDRETIVAGLRNISPLFTPYGDDVKIFSWMSSCGDFFALIGGADRTVNIYKNIMNIQDQTENMNNTSTVAGSQRLNRNSSNFDDTRDEDSEGVKETRKSKRERRGKRRNKKHKITEITEDGIESEIAEERGDEQDITVLYTDECSSVKDFERQSTQALDDSSQALIDDLLNLWLGITDSSLLYCSRLAEARLLEYLVQFLAKPPQTSHLVRQLGTFLAITRTHVRTHTHCDCVFIS